MSVLRKVLFAVFMAVWMISGSMEAYTADYNRSVTFTPRTAYKTLQDDYVGVPISVLEKNCTATKMQNHDITFGCWFRIQYPTYEVTATQNPDALLMSINDIVKCHANNFGNGLRVVVDRGTKCLKLMSDTTGAANKGSLLFENSRTSVVIPENEWHFVALTLSHELEGTGTNAASMVELYFDGMKIATTTKRSFAAWYSNNTSIEPWFVAGGFGLNGAVDDIYIYDKCLTDDEMKSLYTRGPNDSDETLLGWYSLDDVYPGTTGQFENLAVEDGVKAQYLTFSPASTIRKGIVEGEPDLATITPETQRPLTLETGTPRKLSIAAPAEAKYLIVDDYQNLIDPQAATAGSRLTLLFENYHLFSNIEVALDEEPLDGELGRYSFTMPDNDALLSITAQKNETVRMAIRDFGGGTFAVSDGRNRFADGDEVTIGSPLRFAATPAEGYYLNAIKVNGLSLADTDGFTAPAEDFAIYADFLANDDYNHAITFIEDYAVQSYSEDRLDIDAGIIGVEAREDQAEAVFSVGAWVRQRSYTSGGILLQLAPGQLLTRTPYFGIMVDNSGNLKVTTLKIGPEGVDLGVNLPKNEWHYLCFAVNIPATEVTTYLDGVKCSTVRFNEIGTAPSSTHGGYCLSMAAYSCYTDIDELHLFDRLVSDGDVALAYIDDVEEMPGLVGWYQFEPEDKLSKGKFANHVASMSDLAATYTTFTKLTKVDNGYVVDASTEGTANTTQITRELARPRANIDDHTVTIVTDEGCSIESFLLVADDEENRLIDLIEGERIRKGSTMRQIITLAEGASLVAIRLNGQEIGIDSEAATAFDVADAQTSAAATQVDSGRYHLDHIVTGPTILSVETSVGTTAVELPAIDPADSDLPTRFYDINGIEVSPTHLAPGLYILKAGSHSGKILIR